MEREKGREKRWKRESRNEKNNEFLQNGRERNHFLIGIFPTFVVAILFWQFFSQNNIGLATMNKKKSKERRENGTKVKNYGGK